MKRLGINRLGSSTAMWILAIDVGLIVLFGALSEDNAFWSTASLQNIGLDAAQALILATGIALLLGAAEIDLSVGASLLLSSVFGAKVLVAMDGSGVLAGALVCLLVCLVSGGLIGLFNGLVVTKLGVTSLIATLATMGIAMGLANLITDGADIASIPVALQNDFGIRLFLNIPLPAFLALVVWGLTWLAFATTRFGMRSLALGSSRGAAERSGIRVHRHLIGMFVLVGAMAGIAGFLDLTRFATTNLGGHGTDSLAAITAAVIGGTSLFGGRVSLAGVLSGTLLAVILQSGLVVVGLSPFYQQIAVGAVLIVAVFLDQRQSPGSGRLRLRQ